MQALQPQRVEPIPRAHLTHRVWPQRGRLFNQLPFNDVGRLQAVIVSRAPENVMDTMVQNAGVFTGCNK